MNAATLKALRSSIAHWRRMATGKAKQGERPSGIDCPLCEMFRTDLLYDCRGCPVAESVPRRPNGTSPRQGCINTPYETARAASQDYGLSSPQFLLAASKELEFLKSLLPKRAVKRTKQGGLKPPAG
jgi:hypothetical protein